MEIQIQNFTSRIGEKKVTHRFNVVDQCVQGKAMAVPEIIQATNRGIIANGDLFRKLPDDGNEVLTEHEDFADGSDYLDLAIAGQRKAELKEKVKADHEKTQEQLKKNAKKAAAKQPASTDTEDV